MESTEKLPGNPRVASNQGIEGEKTRRALEADLNLEADLKAAQEELELLEIEEAMIQELVAQEKMIQEMQTLNDSISEMTEREKSLLNSNIPASSDMAPSVFSAYIIFKWVDDFI